jgi:hypothetical protein
MAMSDYRTIQRRLERLEGKTGSALQGNGPAQVIITRYTQEWQEIERGNPALEAQIATEVKVLTQIMATEAALVGYDKPYDLTLYARDDGEITPAAPPWAPLFPPDESGIIRLQLALHNQDLHPTVRLLFEHTIEMIQRMHDLARDGKRARWPARPQDWRKTEHACGGAQERILAKLQQYAQCSEGREP